MEIAARLMRFYGMSFAEASNLSHRTAIRLLEILNEINKEELYAQLQVISFPHAKKQQQMQIIKWLKPKEQLSSEEVQNKLEQILPRL